MDLQFALGDGFTLVELSDSIRTLPTQYGKVNALGLFKWKPLRLRTVSIESMNGVLRLVPTTPWGGKAPKNTPTGRKARAFNIPHMPFEDLVEAQDVVGLRAFGTSNELDTVANQVNTKLQDMRNKLDTTLEWRKVGALKGIIYDADGTSVIENLFDAFGIPPHVVNFHLDNPATDVRAICVNLSRWMETHLGGESSTGTTVMVSSEFFDALISHPRVEKIFLGWAAAQTMLATDLRGGFVFGGITFWEYAASVDGMAFVDPGKGHAYPLGTSNLFSTYGAPADFVETVNTMALPYYAKQRNTDFDRGIELHTQANQLPFANRPELLVECLAE